MGEEANKIFTSVFFFVFPLLSFHNIFRNLLYFDTCQGKQKSPAAAFICLFNDGRHYFVSSSL
jgi:hypothetical protein